MREDVLFVSSRRRQDVSYWKLFHEWGSSFFIWLVFKEGRAVQVGQWGKLKYYLSPAKFTFYFTSFTFSFPMPLPLLFSVVLIALHNFFRPFGRLFIIARFKIYLSLIFICSGKRAHLPQRLKTATFSFRFHTKHKRPWRASQSSDQPTHKEIGESFRESRQHY